MDHLQIVIFCSSVFRIICAQDDKTSVVKWIPLQEFRFENPDPHGFSLLYEKDLYIGRIEKDNGYQIGYYHPTELESIYVIDEDEEGQAKRVKKTEVEKGELELMVAQPGATSWRIIDIDMNNPNLEAFLEELRKDLIPGGIDPTGTEEQYICRILFDGDDADVIDVEENGYLVVGAYYISKPLICRAVKDTYVEAIESDKFELLTYNLVANNVNKLSQEDQIRQRKWKTLNAIFKNKKFGKM